MYQALIKSYTSPGLHNNMSLEMAKGKYDSIQTYLTRYIDCLNKNRQFAYQSFSTPLWRSVDNKMEGFDIS